MLSAFFCRSTAYLKAVLDAFLVSAFTLLVKREYPDQSRRVGLYTVLYVVVTIIVTLKDYMGSQPFYDLCLLFSLSLISGKIPVTQQISISLELCKTQCDGDASHLYKRVPLEFELPSLVSGVCFLYNRIGFVRI